VYRACRLGGVNKCCNERSSWREAEDSKWPCPMLHPLASPPRWYALECLPPKLSTPQLTQAPPSKTAFSFANKGSPPLRPTISLITCIDTDPPPRLLCLLPCNRAPLWTCCSPIYQVHLPCLVDRHNPALHRRLRTRRENQPRGRHVFAQPYDILLRLSTIFSPLTMSHFGRTIVSISNPLSYSARQRSPAHESAL
jgi:hypothetical protein